MNCNIYFILANNQSAVQINCAALFYFRPYGQHSFYKIGAFVENRSKTFSTILRMPTFGNIDEGICVKYSVCFLFLLFSWHGHSNSIHVTSLSVPAIQENKAVKYLLHYMADSSS